VNADSGSYSDHPLEDYSDRGTGGSISHRFANTSVGVDGDYTLTHEVRSDPSFPADAIEQPRFSRRSAVLDVSQAFPAGSLSFKGDLASFDYDSVRTVDGELDQSAKNHDLDSFTLEGGFLVRHSASAFIRFVQVQQRYPAMSQASFDRDAATNTLLGGVTLDVTNLIRGELAVGTLHVDNADPRQEDSRAFTVNSNIEFFVTRLVSATLIVEHNSGAANLPGSATYVATRGSFRLDYEIRRDLLLTAQANRSRRNYSGIDQTETIASAGLSARWLLNRHMNLEVSYATVDRHWPPGQGIESYTADVVSLGLNLAL
jgi:hypothetical protein